MLFKKTTAAIVLMTFCQSSFADLSALTKMLEKAKANGTNPSTQNQTGASNTSATNNTTGTGNTFQKANDPAREEVKRQKLVLAAIKSGTPIEISEDSTKDKKDEALAAALVKAVSVVHNDFGAYTKNDYAIYTNTEYAKNITKPSYGLIASYEKIAEKENIWAPMGQPDPSKSTWSTKVKAVINTKLSVENIKAIATDQRILYVGSMGQTVQEAKFNNILTAVKQYHRINIAPNSVFAKNMLNPNYGVIQKIDVLQEGPLPYGGMMGSKLKITFTDINELPPKKLAQIKQDMQASLLPEKPNPIMNSVNAALDDINLAETKFENALQIKGMSEMIKEDAEREKAGNRLGSSGIEQKVAISEKRMQVIDARLKENPQLDEAQKKEFQSGLAPYSKGVAGLVGSVATGANVMKSVGQGGDVMGDLLMLVTTMSQIPRILGVFSNATATLTGYNTNNGVDNKPIEEAKVAMGD